MFYKNIITKKLAVSHGILIALFLYVVFFVSSIPVYAGCTTVNVGGQFVQLCGVDTSNPQDHWMVHINIASSFEQLANWIESGAQHAGSIRTATSISCFNGVSAAIVSEGGGSSS